MRLLCWGAQVPADVAPRDLAVRFEPFGLRVGHRCSVCGVDTLRCAVLPKTTACRCPCDGLTLLWWHTASWVVLMRLLLLMMLLMTQQPRLRHAWRLGWCVHSVRRGGGAFLEGRLERGIVPAECVWMQGGADGEDGCLLLLRKMNLELLRRCTSIWLCLRTSGAVLTSALAGSINTRL